MKNTIILFLVPPKFFISIVFNFSWDLNQDSGRGGRDEKRAANSGVGGGREQQGLNSYRPVAFNSFGLLL